MFKKQVMYCLLLLVCSSELIAVDEKYCRILQEVHSGMNIKDVFLFLGPPHTFGQPPNLDTRKLNSNDTGSSLPTQQTPTSPENDDQARARMLAAIQQDPILNAFINAKDDSHNVLIWSFENNTLTVAVKVQGATVTDVNANFSCP